MPPIIREEEMDAMDSSYESDDEPMSMEMLEDICDRSKSHPKVNKREERSKIRDCIKQRQSEWKVKLKAKQNMGNGLQKVFKTFVKEISQDLLLGGSGSEVSHLIPEPRNFSEVNKLSYDKK